MSLPYLSYGSYAFEPASVWFTISKRALIGQTGRRQYVHEQWHITGRVTGTTTDEVVTKVNALQDAMWDGYDLVFTVGHSLLSADCTEGTHVRELTWLPGYDGVRGSGAELVLRRTFRLVIDGKKVAPTDTDIIFYREVVNGIGTGGPVIKPVRSLAGGVQAQQTVQFTEYWAQQSGVAIGLTNPPPASTRLWLGIPGVYYIPDKVSVGLHAPQHFGINQNTGFRTDWSYTCWSTVPLATSPLLIV